MSAVVLVCSVCGSSTEVSSTATVAGQPLMDWWTWRGYRCGDCFTKPVEGDTRGTIQARFEEFHRLNPRIYERLRSLAMDLVARGRARIGVRMLYEVVRWEHAVSTTDPSGEFKLNDHYISRYARLLADRNPQLAGKVETRRLKAS